MTHIFHYTSPLGGITLAHDGNGLTGLWFDGQKYFGSTLSSEHDTGHSLLFRETTDWLDRYFSGRCPDFTPVLSLSSTPFRIAVWDLLLTIPYGQTITYGQIARQLAKSSGSPSMSAQAVGGAVGHNPISLIIPCHRVVGSGGSLTGYAGGLEKKRWLLELEQRGIE